MNYETKIVHFANGDSYEYVICDGTWFTYGKNIQNEGWKYKENKSLWEILSALINSGRRVRIWYGDTTGRSWNIESEFSGTIERNCGKIAIPFLRKNSRSHGGVALLDSFIIRIDDIKEKRTIYKSDNFHVEDMKVYEIFGDANYKYRVKKLSEDSGEWEVQASFKTEQQAFNYVAFMRGERYRI